MVVNLKLKKKLRANLAVKKETWNRCGFLENLIILLGDRLMDGYAMCMEMEETPLPAVAEVNSGGQ